MNRERRAEKNVIPTRTELVESLQNAGFKAEPATRTSESGLIFTDPANGNLYRIMEGSTYHPPRLITTSAGGNTLAPWGGKIPANIIGRPAIRSFTHFPLKP